MVLGLLVVGLVIILRVRRVIFYCSGKRGWEELGELGKVFLKRWFLNNLVRS